MRLEDQLTHELIRSRKRQARLLIGSTPGGPRRAVEQRSLTGRVVTGRGEGAFYPRLDWTRERFRTGLGIDPSPGTLNLRLEAA